jgi:hypothetical protein
MLSLFLMALYLTVMNVSFQPQMASPAVDRTVLPGALASRMSAAEGHPDAASRNVYLAAREVWV